MSRLLPKATPTSEPYWQGCKLGELRLQQCESCLQVQFYPRVLCTACEHQTLTWIVASGRGRIASFTIIHRGVSPDYSTPLVVALIDLEEGPRLMSHIVGCHAQSAKIGDRVTVRFERWSDDVAVPVFELERTGERE